MRFFGEQSGGRNQMHDHAVWEVRTRWRFAAWARVEVGGETTIVIVQPNQRQQACRRIGVIRAVIVSAHR